MEEADTFVIDQLGNLDAEQSIWWVSSTPFGIPFSNQFNSRIGVLVHSSFAND